MGKMCTGGRDMSCLILRCTLVKARTLVHPLRKGMHAGNLIASSPFDTKAGVCPDSGTSWLIVTMVTTVMTIIML